MLIKEHISYVYSAFLKLFVLASLKKEIKEGHRKTLLCNRGDSFHTSVFGRCDVCYIIFEEDYYSYIKYFYTEQKNPS